VAVSDKIQIQIKSNHSITQTLLWLREAFLRTVEWSQIAISTAIYIYDWCAWPQKTFVPKQTTTIMSSSHSIHLNN